jgi:hypothetical protein
LPSDLPPTSTGWSLFLRRYYTVPKRQRPAVADALRQMRETQTALGPEFMTRIKMLVKDFDPEALFGSHTDESPEDHVAKIETEAVDKKKNLLIVMKFLQIKQGNKDVQSQVRTLLSENTTIQ